MSKHNEDEWPAAPDGSDMPTLYWQTKDSETFPQEMVDVLKMVWYTYQQHKLAVPPGFTVVTEMDGQKSCGVVFYQ